MDTKKQFEGLLKEAKSFVEKRSDQFDLLETRTKMYIRKIFGEDSHYLKDMERINYMPPIMISGTEPDWELLFSKWTKTVHYFIDSNNRRH